MVRTNSMNVGELPINGQNSALIFENHWSRDKYALPLPGGSRNRATPILDRYMVRSKFRKSLRLLYNARQIVASRK